MSIQEDVGASEFRSQFPAERTEFRCRRAPTNVTQDIELQHIFDAERGDFPLPEQICPCQQGKVREPAPRYATIAAIPAIS